MTHHDLVTVGIDLGTTNSCVAIYRNARPEVIANEYGDYVTPSCVAFEEGQPIVGKDARCNILVRPTNTVFAIKRIIGRKFDDYEVQTYKSRWPVKIVSVDGLPHIDVTDTEIVNEQSSRAVSRYKPEDISCFILNKMKNIAEDFLNRSPNSPPLHAVITVPASFSDSQSRATKAAGEQAGLKVVAVVNEPTAAAVAYELNRGNENETILVFDFGGGKLDVSIIRMTNGRKFAVLSTAGNTNLGGEDVNERLLEHCVSEFENAYNVRVDRAGRGVLRLRLRVENTKKGFLSPNSEMVFRVDAFHKAEDLICTITTAKFDELCEDLFQKALEPVQEALQRANLQKTDITQIVLVGGSSRILKIREMLGTFFVNQAVNRDIDAELAIACGAAILAHQLANENSATIEESH